VIAGSIILAGGIAVLAINILRRKNVQIGKDSNDYVLIA
jgi:hypothetical protein